MKYHHLFFYIFTVFSFILTVILKWTTGETAYNLIGGLLPWSDAHGHFYGSLYLLERGIADPWTTRRLMSAGYNAMRSLAAGRNLQAMLILQAALTGTACFLAARAIWLTHGLAAGFIVLLLSTSFVLVYLPSTLTEPVGLMFGALSFSLVWQGIYLHRLGIASIGLLLLGVGLSIRPGSVTMLPAVGLAVWAAVEQTEGRLRSALIVLASIVCVFGTNFLMYSLIGNPNGAPQANMLEALYGLSAGGDWTFVFRDIPEASQLTEHELIPVLRARIWQNITTNPQLFLDAYWRGAHIYWRTGLLYGFCWANAAIPTAILLVFVLAVAYRLRDRGGLLLCSVAGFGTLVTGPIAEMNGGSRVFAVSIPFVAALLAIFVQAAFDRIRSRAGFLASLAGHPPAASSPNFKELGFAVAMMSAATILPTGRALLVTASTLISFNTCPADQKPIIFDVDIGSPVLHIRKHSEIGTLAPIVTLKSFEDGLRRHPIEIVDALKGFESDMAVIEPYPLDAANEPGYAPFLIAKEELVPPAGTRVEMCGVETSLNGIQIYRALSSHIIDR